MSDNRPAIAPIHGLTLLRRPFRERLENLLGMLAKEAIPIQCHETIRSPLRQDQLYSIGRNPLLVGYGRTVTRAQPYQSAHQYGLAADLVFRVNGRWTWDEPERGMWDRFGELAAVYELKTLSFEKPHVQIPGFDWKVMTRGPTYVDGWLTWLAETNV